MESPLTLLLRLLAAAFLVFLVTVDCEISAQSVKCATPKSTEGECIYLENCPFLQEMSDSNNLTTEEIAYLRQSQCDFTDLQPKVCCPVSNKTMPFRLPEPYVRFNQTQLPTRSVSNRFKPDEGLPDINVCGRQVFDNKIFNGEITAIDEFPWMALLEYKKKRLNSHGFACGGALITDRYVLTAAHCVSGQNAAVLGGLVNVRLGEHNIDTPMDCDEINPMDCAPPPIDLGIEKMIIHPEYDEDNMDQTHDIALLKLERKVEFNDFLRPICLSTKLPQMVHDPNQLQYVAGWGYTEFMRNSPVKRKLKVPLVAEKSCADKYKSFGIRLSKRQLCAGGERHKDSCMGDSGGPLMVQAVSNKSGVVWYMTGIVSIGPTPCATDGIPGIYTKVFDYMDWILQHIRSV